MTTVTNSSAAISARLLVGRVRVAVSDMRPSGSDLSWRAAATSTLRAMPVNPASYIPPSGAFVQP